MAEPTTTARGTADRGKQTSRAGATQTAQENRTTTSTQNDARNTSGDHENGNTAGQGFMGRVRDRAGERLSLQKNRASDTISVVARAVRQSSASLRQDNPTVADYVERAADQLDRLCMRVKDKDAGELLRSAQNFSRRRPAMFIGSAFAIGLVGARFMRSSPPSSGATRPTSWRRGPGSDTIGPSGDPGGLEALQTRNYSRVDDPTTTNVGRQRERS